MNPKSVCLRNGISARVRSCFVAAVLICTFGAPSKSVSAVIVYGGPTYDATTQTGYQFPALMTNPGSTAGSGVAVGSDTKYSGGTNLGNRAVRWDASGNAAIEMGNLGTNSTGMTFSTASAVNSGGVAVGFAAKYVGGNSVGNRAVRWTPSGTVTELGNLGTDSDAFTTSWAYALNGAGTAAGFAQKYSAGANLGQRAVRWDASGTAATELGVLGSDGNAATRSEAYDVNGTGTAVGYAEKFTGGVDHGTRAVRWAGSGTAATELGNLGIDSGGNTQSFAYAINTAGTTVGYAEKYVGLTDVGIRAVRWGASTATATELGNLGTDGNGFTASNAIAINTLGVAVGYARKYTAGNFTGLRAVRWDPFDTAATELGNLGTDASGGTGSQAWAINSAGAAVGWAQKYNGGVIVGQRAVLWKTDGSAIDLNTLISPTSGWTLTEARGISDTNWVTGYGDFDPDGTGPTGAYQRPFLLDVSSVVPEPSSLVLVACALSSLILRVRSSRR